MSEQHLFLSIKLSQSLLHSFYSKYDYYTTLCYVYYAIANQTVITALLLLQSPSSDPLQFFFRQQGNQSYQSFPPSCCIDTARHPLLLHQIRFVIASSTDSAIRRCNLPVFPYCKIQFESSKLETSHHQRWSSSGGGFLHYRCPTFRYRCRENF